MKKIIFLLTFILLVLISNAQTDTILKYFKNIPEISANNEVLNRDLFPGVITKKQRDSLFNAFENYKMIVKKIPLIEDRCKMPNGINPYREIEKIGKTYYKELDSNGLVKKYYQSFEMENVVGRETINPYIYIYKVFYLNDSLMVKGLSSIFGFNIGKWYYFDNKGNISKIVDTDEGYDFTTEDIIKFCIKKGINLGIGTPSNYKAFTKIERIKEKDKFLWRISDYTFGRVFEIVLDGKTGAVISQRRYDLIE